VPPLDTFFSCFTHTFTIEFIAILTNVSLCSPRCGGRLSFIQSVGKIQRPTNYNGTATMLFFWVFILFQVHLTHNLVQAKTPTTLFPNAKSVNLVEIWSKDDFHCHVKRSDRPVIVVFYSHWCGHCKKYSPKFEKMVGQVFQEQKSWQNMITLAVVNCGASSVKIDRICSNLAISRVPTSMWFNGNHAQSF